MCLGVKGLRRVRSCSRTLGTHSRARNSARLDFRQACHSVGSSGLLTVALLPRLPPAYSISLAFSIISSKALLMILNILLIGGGTLIDRRSASLRHETVSPVLSRQFHCPRVHGALAANFLLFFEDELFWSLRVGCALRCVLVRRCSCAWGEGRGISTLSRKTMTLGCSRK